MPSFPPSSEAPARFADPATAAGAGAHSRLGDHGLYGALLLASPTLAQVLDLAVDYQALAPGPIAFGRAPTGWIVPDRGSTGVPAARRGALVAFQFARLAAHVRELAADADPGPTARFAQAPFADRAACEDAIGGPCVFDAPRDALCFDPGLLDRPLPRANPLALPVLRAACDRLLAERERAAGFVGRVRAILDRLQDPGASMTTVAAALHMTDRTLRRRLADEGTSFTALTRETRQAIATRHLESSAATVEEIANLAGFTDTANFRRAFIRWTHLSPARYRDLSQRAAG